MDCAGARHDGGLAMGRWRCFLGASQLGPHDAEQRERGGRVCRACEGFCCSRVCEWNSLAPADGCYKPGRPESLSAPPACPRYGQRVLVSRLAEMVDLGLIGKTNCGATSPWAAWQLRTKARILERAVQAAGVSDHAPLVCAFAEATPWAPRANAASRCALGSAESAAAVLC